MTDHRRLSAFNNIFTCIFIYIYTHKYILMLVYYFCEWSRLDADFKIISIINSLFVSIVCIVSRGLYGVTRIEVAELTHNTNCTRQVPRRIVATNNHFITTPMFLLKPINLPGSSFIWFILYSGLVCNLHVIDIFILVIKSFYNQPSLVRCVIITGRYYLVVFDKNTLFIHHNTALLLNKQLSFYAELNWKSRLKRIEFVQNVQLT